MPAVPTVPSGVLLPSPHALTQPIETVTNAAIEYFRIEVS